MGRHRADGARLEQMPRDRADRDAALGAVGALEDLVEQVEQHAPLTRLLGRVDDPFEPRERRHEVRQPELERILNPDARLQIRRRQAEPRRAHGSRPPARAPR